MELYSTFQSRIDTKMTLQIMQKRVEVPICCFIERQSKVEYNQTGKSHNLYGDKIERWREQSLSNNVKKYAKKSRVSQRKDEKDEAKLVT